MKTSRHIVLSILLTLSLLAAPIAFAQPHSPSLGDFDVVEWITGLIDDVVAIFAPVSPTIDSNGATEDSGIQKPDNSPKKPGQNDGLPVIDTNG